MENQNSIFKNSEADCWYSRNKLIFEKSGVSKDELPFEIGELCLTLEPFKKNIKRVLEIGCSSGKKLEAICNVLEAAGDGLEPSNMAVKEGNQRLKESNVKITCGTADRLPFESHSFDLVYFGFCAYLFDRGTLLLALAEADRVLKSGGFLAITDFDPGTRSKRPYIHKPGVYSYKQDYSKIFTESGLYYLVSKSSFSHRQPFFDLIADERVALFVMHKEVDPYPLNLPLNE